VGDFVTVVALWLPALNAVPRPKAGPAASLVDQSNARIAWQSLHGLS